MFHGSLFPPETFFGGSTNPLSFEAIIGFMEATSTQRGKERRKWQMAFRRFVLDEATSQEYAHYFGLDKKTIRKWFELQFTDGLTWDNFGTHWQFDHIVPVAYFNFDNEQDMRLCWNFINIRVEGILQNKYRGGRVDVLAVRRYFEDLYKRTKFALCLAMLQKIESLEISLIESNQKVEAFLIENKGWLEQLSDLNKDEFARYNSGIPLKEILLEREILKKFGN
jgi:hypothetical protein